MAILNDKPNHSFRIEIETAVEIIDPDTHYIVIGKVIDVLNEQPCVSRYLNLTLPETENTERLNLIAEEDYMRCSTVGSQYINTTYGELDVEEGTAKMSDMIGAVRTLFESTNLAFSDLVKDL